MFEAIYLGTKCIFSETGKHHLVIEYMQIMSKTIKSNKNFLDSPTSQGYPSHSVSLLNFTTILNREYNSFSFQRSPHLGCWASEGQLCIPNTALQFHQTSLHFPSQWDQYSGPSLAIPTWHYMPPEMGAAANAVHARTPGAGNFFFLFFKEEVRLKSLDRSTCIIQPAGPVESP